MPEVAVVGGGVMGASIAYHLAAAGIDDVVLYERHALASGPTGRSTGLIRLHYSQPLLVRMAAAGLALYSSSRARGRARRARAQRRRRPRRGSRGGAALGGGRRATR